MIVIHINKKTIFVVTVVVVFYTISQFESHFYTNTRIWNAFFNTGIGFICNRHLSWRDVKLKENVGILGVEGSGVVWLRYLVEQLTGIYTGSSTVQYADHFKGEGKKEMVLGMMSHWAENVPYMAGAIVMYRNMKDVVRTQFAEQYSKGAFLEAPLHAYYGPAWRKFAVANSQLWVKQYMGYLSTGKPLLVIGYEELEDPERLRKNLLLISHMLHVPVKHSVIDCLVDRSAEFDLKPRHLKSSFQPFSLLPPEEQRRLESLEQMVLNQISRARDHFIPGVG